MKGKKEQRDKAGKGADDIDINELILSSKRAEPINIELLRKLEEKEHLVEKLAKEVARLRNEESARKSSETESRDETIRRLTEELRRSKEQFLITEASARKKVSESGIIAQQNEQLKKGNDSLLKAFSKIKAEHLAISEAATAAERELQQKLKENDLLRISTQKLREERDSARVAAAGENGSGNSGKNENKELFARLNSADKKLENAVRIIEESNRKMSALAEENQKLRSRIASFTEISKTEKEENLANAKKELARKCEENIILAKKMKESEAVIYQKERENEKLRKLAESDKRRIEEARSEELKSAAESDERKKLAVQLLKERRDADNYRKELTLKEVLMEKMREELSQLKEGRINEMRSRKELDEYGKKIEFLRKQVIETRKELDEKVRAAKALQEEKEALKKEFRTELNKRETKNLAEQLDSAKRENNELRMLAQQEKDNSSRMRDIIGYEFKIEAAKRDAAIKKLTDELKTAREQFLVAEASSRKSGGKFDSFASQNEQLKKGNESLLKAFSKIKSERLAISEAATAAERELQQKLKENDLLRISMQKLREERDSARLAAITNRKDSGTSGKNENKELLANLDSANKKIDEYYQNLEEMSKKMALLMRENQTLKAGALSMAERSRNEKEKSLADAKKIIAKKDEENLLLMKKISETDIVLSGKMMEIEELRKKIEGSKSNAGIRAGSDERKNLAIQFLKERRDADNYRRELKVKEILLEKLREDISELKEGYVNEMQNRKVLDEYGERIDSLRSQVISSQKALNEKEIKAKALEEEKRVLKEELDIEIKSGRAENVVEQFDSVRRENDELKMLMQQEKENSSRMQEYYTKLMEMQKTEYDGRINSIIASGAEKEVELNSVMENLSRTLEEKNAKLERQKDFYLDMQRMIRQNILESGIILDEEKNRETHKKAILDFLLKKGARTEAAKKAAEKEREAAAAKQSAQSAFIENSGANAPAPNSAMSSINTANAGNMFASKEIMEMPPTPIPPGVKMAGQPANDDKTEEIMSVINIAKQHGDNDEQIKASLTNSGYDAGSIDRAFSLTKK